MKIEIETKKFNDALHHITCAISLLQEIREEFLDSIQQQEEEEKNHEDNANLVGLN